jgi:hypothetical protein
VTIAIFPFKDDVFSVGIDFSRCTSIGQNTGGSDRASEQKEAGH